MTKCIVITAAVLMAQLTATGQTAKPPDENLNLHASASVTLQGDTVTFRVLGLMKTKSGAT